MVAGPGIITFLSDFGLSDGYVASVKGVVASLAPGIRVVDATHAIAPQCILSAAYVLSSYWRSFPRGSVHLAVVDPGVGSTRRILAVQAAGHAFVAPDNGLLSFILKEKEVAVYALEIPESSLQSVSCTFHGRDIMAPAAARMAEGSLPADLGHAISDPVVLEGLEATEAPGGILLGQVLHIDRFGNAITNVRREMLRGERGFRVEIGSRSVDEGVEYYAQAGRGRPVALFGSSGHLEIAVCGGSAAHDLALFPGAALRVLTR